MSMSVTHVYGIGAFFSPIEDEFGWSRANIASGLTVLTVIGAVFHPLVGRAIDRFGPRPVAIPGLLLYWAGLSSLSFVNSSLFTWWLLWALAGIGATCVKPTVWIAAVTSAFRVSRGVALAIALSGMAVSSSLLPIAATYSISRFGWHGALIALPAMWGVVVVPIVIWLFRSRSYQEPDIETKEQPIPGGLSVREGLRSAVFIKLAIVAIVATLIIPTTVVNLIPIVTSKGFGREAAAGMAALIGIASIAGRLLSGFLLDRFDARWIGAISLLLPMFAMALLLAGSGSAPMLMVAIFILGFALGAEVDVVVYLLSRFMGLKNFGFFMSVITTCWTIATGSGPVVASAIYDATGSYDIFLVSCIPGAILSSFLLATLGSPPSFETHEAPISGKHELFDNKAAQAG